jgi:hypothetical protein
MRIFKYLFTALLVMAPLASAQETRVPIKEIQPVAQKALETFSQLVTKENYAQMGFDSTEQVRTATLGIPIQDFIVRLDTLKKYIPGSMPEELLTASNQVIYPVLVKDQVRSSITISKTKENWQPVSFGGSNFVKLASKTLMENSRETGLDHSSYFLVRVPSLNLFFLGYRSNTELMLVPLMDDKRLEFKAGVGIKAGQVFSAILPDAKAHDGLPR